MTNEKTPLDKLIEYAETAMADGYPYEVIGEDLALTVKALRALRVEPPAEPDVLQTFWREIVKVWDAQGIASDRVGIDVTIGLPLIEAARTVVNRPAEPT